MLTIGGRESLIFGQISTLLKIGKNSFEISAQVLEFSEQDIILGKDFLENTGAIVNFGSY